MAFLAENFNGKIIFWTRLWKIKLTNLHKNSPPLLSDSRRYEMYCRKVPIRISCAYHRPGFDYGPNVLVSLGSGKSLIKIYDDF